MRKLENEGILLVYSTLPKVRAAQTKTLAKCIPLKVTYLSYRKKTKIFRRRLRSLLMRKGC